MYIVFPHKRNWKLFDTIILRLKELGYTKFNELILPSPNEYYDVSINANIGYVTVWGTHLSTNFTAGYPLANNAKIGDFNLLFLTDEYKVVKKPTQVKLNNDYTAEVTDKVKVGCQEFSIEKLEELLEASRKWKNEN